MPYKGNYTTLDINKQAIFQSGITIKPDNIYNDISGTYVISNGLVIISNSVNITNNININLPSINNNEIGLEIKIVNLNPLHSTIVNVNNITDLINKKYTNITLKPLSNLYLISVSENDWWTF